MPKISDFDKMTIHPDAHKVDAIIAKRIKQRRTFLEMTQDKLADFIGVSYAQLQKYERAENRVSASRLYDIAQVLHADPNWFMDWKTPQHQMMDMLNLDERKVVDAYRAMPEDRRRQALTILRTLAA